jgi:hypothetical protein
MVPPFYHPRNPMRGIALDKSAINSSSGVGKDPMGKARRCVIVPS